MATDPDRIAAFLDTLSLHSVPEAVRLADTTRPARPSGPGLDVPVSGRLTARTADTLVVVVGASVLEVPVAAVASIEREPDAAAEADDSGDGSVPVRLGLAPDAPIVVRRRLTAGELGAGPGVVALLRHRPRYGAGSLRAQSRSLTWVLALL